MVTNDIVALLRDHALTTGTSHQWRDGLLDPTRPRGGYTITPTRPKLLPVIQPRSGVVPLYSKFFGALAGVTDELVRADLGYLKTLAKAGA